MFKNVLFRALLAAAAVSVVTLAPTEASAQERTRPSGDKAAAAKAKSKEAAKAEAKAEAKAKAKEAAKEHSKKVHEKAAKQADQRRAEAAAVAAANAEAAEAAKKAAEEAHARKLGKIERLEQIATATNNDELKAQVAKLKELEDKRHNLALAKIAAEGESK